MNKIFDNFWKWYEKHYTLNLAFASFLFFWQVVHLTWLFTHVIWLRLFGFQLLHFNDFWETAIILVDYTEIPAIISVGFIYINEVRKKFIVKDFVLLCFLLSQVFHIFWITDEYVTETLVGQLFVGIPTGLAWAAILVDYLELPVMYETFRRLKRRLFNAKGQKTNA